MSCLCVAGGQYYSGDWHNGLKSGYGVAQFRNGDVYEGDWRNNKMSGQGVYQWKNATKFVGSFREDELNGEGVCEWPSGRQVRPEQMEVSCRSMPHSR